MIRGTTPTHTFTLPFDVDLIKSLRVIYQQNDETVLIKTLTDCAVAGNVISYKLTQEETLQFAQNAKVSIQIRVLTNDGDALASRICTVGVGACLEDGVIM